MQSVASERRSVDWKGRFSNGTSLPLIFRCVVGSAADLSPPPPRPLTHGFTLIGGPADDAHRQVRQLARARTHTRVYIYSRSKLRLSG